MKLTRRAIATATLVLAALTMSAPCALAAYGEVGSFSGSGSGDGELNSPRDAALEYSSGNLFVVDRGNDRVQVFDPDGDSATYLTQFSAGLDDPTGIAIGESGGETVVYVSSAATNEIVKFDSDEQAVPSFTLDAAFASPATGSAPGELASFDVPLAVDRTSGDLLVADRGNNRVNRYAADGTFDSSFDGSSSPAPFTGLVDIAADSTGDILVVDSSGDIYSDGTGTSSRVERFTSAGAHELTLGPIDGPGSVTTDPDDGRVFVGGKFHTWNSTAMPRIYVFEADGALAGELELNAMWAITPGLAAEDGGSTRLFIVTRDPFDSGYGPTGVRVFRDTTPPTAAATAPTNVTSSEATLHGAVNPNGVQTEWHFEYRRVGADSWMSTPVEDAGAGTDDVEVAAVASLAPAATYEVRLVASSTDGTTISSTVEFEAGPAAPTAEPAGRATTRSTSAIVYGVVVPFGLPTKYHFEFGEDSGYGRRSPENHSASAGRGADPVTAARTLTDLKPNTTYHYRLVAENAMGTVVGPDRTFTTAAQDPPRRPYEMVSPPDKNGSEVGVISGAAAGGVMSPSGDRIGFMSNNAFAGAPSAGFKSWYMTSRGSASWTTTPLNPPFRAVYTGGGDGPVVYGVSEDLTKALVFTNVDPITHEAQPRRQGYVHDLVSGTYRLVTPDAVTGGQDYIPTRSDVADIVRAATPDLSYLVIGTQAALTADAVGVAGEKLYRVSSATGQIVLVSVAEDGEPTYWEASGGGQAGAGGPDSHGENVMSEDGSVVFFERTPMLYRRDVRSGETEAVNVRDGVSFPSWENATFLEASRDGRYVFFNTTQNLLPEDENSGSDVYRYDAEAPDGNRLELISVDSEPSDGTAGGAGTSVAASASGDRLFFSTAGQQLVQGAPLGAGNHLFAWDDGTLKYIATDMSAPARYLAPTFDRSRWAHADPLGNFVAVITPDHLTAPEGAVSPQATQVYLYDVRESSPTDPDLVCASCLPAPAITPWGAGSETEMSSGWPVHTRQRHVTSDGAVLFETPTPLVPEDRNGPGRDYSWTFDEGSQSSRGKDVYVYRDGSLELISSGRDERSSYAFGISRDGRTVAFATSEQLSGWDFDSSYDVYAARVGGGLPEPPATQPPCAGDDCQGAAGDRPELKAPASGSPGRDGEARSPASFSLSRVGAAQLRRIARSGRMTVAVRVDRPGRIGVAARARIGKRSAVVGRSTKHARASGLARLRLRLSPPARMRLAKTGRLRITLSVSFGPAAQTKRTTFVLVRSASRKAAAR